MVFGHLFALPSQSLFVGVWWCIVNMIVIFHKILNTKANLFVCSVDWP